LVLGLRRFVVLGGGLVALSFAAPSSAPAAGTMPIDAAQTEPAQAVHLTAGQPSVAFKVIAPPCSTDEMSIEVASRDTYDANSSLADAAQEDYFALTQTSPGVFQGQTSAPWLKKPGLYFWQAYALANCGGVFNSVLEYVSATRQLFVAPAPSAPAAIPAVAQTLSVAQAKAEVPKVILKRTTKAARGLKRKCLPRSAGGLIVDCAISWSDSRKYSYSGTMRVTRNDDGTLSARFDGRRARRTCLTKGGGRSCYKKWAFS
jgi:hypothetical protein